MSASYRNESAVKLGSTTASLSRPAGTVGSWMPSEPMSGEKSKAVRADLGGEDVSKPGAEKKAELHFQRITKRRSAGIDGRRLPGLGPVTVMILLRNCGTRRGAGYFSFADTGGVEVST